MRQPSAPLDSICPPVRVCEPERRRPDIPTGDLLGHVRAVIAETGCTMLLIERSVRVGGTSIRIDAVYPDGSRSKGIARSGDPAMRAVCHAADAMLRQLGELLPSGLNDRTGVLSDGTGVLFSLEQPSVMTADWLGPVFAGTVPCIALSPSATSGLLASLIAPQQCGRAH